VEFKNVSTSFRNSLISLVNLQGPATNYTYPKMTKPIILYGHGSSPNPVKIGIFLEELGIPFEVKNVDFATELKAEPYISLNPNGRVPAIEDPNTGVYLFEV
jgi:hypothetical protein